MLVKLMKGKIHRAVVTQSDLNYEGSIGVDEDLLEASGILPYEAVHVWNISNGNRLETYALPMGRGSGQICMNGAGARLAHVGDLVIIASFCWMDEEVARGYEPRVVLIGDGNRVK